MARCRHDPDGNNKVLNSRGRGSKIFRRRVCQKCLKGFTTFEITEERLIKLEQIEKEYCELEDRLWAVISSKGIEQSGLTYPEAEKAIKKIRHDRGACIITVVAANNFLNKDDIQQGSEDAGSE